MKKVMFFCASFLMCYYKVNAFSAACVMDADSGRMLYGVNENEKYLIASTTKIMTALVTLNYANLDSEVTAGKEILDAYGSSIYLKLQEKMTVEDLLYGLSLRSGNDASLTLAVHTAGSVEGFVKLMNDMAQMIGMHETIFENPHGLDEETQNKSTVYDMCLLMREAMKNEEFRKITGTTKWSVKTNFGNYEWYNKNKLLTDYKYATGGKIGFTTKARHTFVSSATKDNKNLVVATFKDADKFNTHKKLYNIYFEEYGKYKLIDKNDLRVDYKKNYRVFTNSDFYMLLKENEISKVKRHVELYQNIKNSDGVHKIGTMSIVLDDVIYKQMNLYAEKIKDEKKSIIERIKEFLRW